MNMEPKSKTRWILAAILSVCCGAIAQQMKSNPHKQEPIKKAVPKFDQFSINEAYRGEVHSLILKIHLARRFRTVIRQAMTEGVNFAGHYIVASWGCGTGCSQFVIVDAITGEASAPPFDTVSFHHPFALDKKWPDFDPEGKWWHKEYVDVPTFKSNSGLLVVEGCIGDHQCGRTFYVMSTAKLKQVYFDPDLPPDGTIALP